MAEGQGKDGIADGYCQCGCGEKTGGTWAPGHQLKADPSNNPRWNGGRKEEGGYAFVSRPEHPRSNHKGYVLEHVVVAEEALGKSISETSPIHHVNGDGTDNRPSNLVVCEDQAYHNHIEMRTRAFRASGNANWRLCTYCGEHDDPETMGCRHRPDRSDEYYHRSCNAAYERERKARVAS